MKNTTINNLRKEIVSKKMINKFELFRVVLTKDNKVFVDHTYQANGRGSYILKDLDSIEQARKKHLLAKSFKTKIDMSIYDELEKIINE
ncbi:RNA-binding protein [Entomoplasma ellychniae]|uniref:RNA-binding protein n=2 Tax=Entomoplasmataceae TaxID=33925 RepID=A0A2S5RGN5_9MOLU|nr:MULTISPECIES: YlxR family protein [Entomoplasmataceae]PPE05085.1 RNA-binding protein [Entomoplasma ellychniae]PPE06382.1 RNA-binding protein [Mesoplasma corruscae]